MILDINPKGYSPHRLHTQERDWAETNCYVDVWIEQLHALGVDPIAAMSFTLGIDFEGDQWTFFKFPLSDLRKLYGIEVQELVIWRSLVEHIEEQINLGRPVLVELDSMFLPDTTGTAYKMAHVKTTASINYIDKAQRRLGYFHAQGYFELEGQDFDNVFRLNKTPDSHLSPYVEIAKIGQLCKKKNNELHSESESLLREQIKLMPKENPFSAFEDRFKKDFPWLLEQSLDVFHEYAFVTFRQFGACFELAAEYLNWLNTARSEELALAAKSYRSISEITKIYQFQLARSVSRGKPLDFGVVSELASEWQTAKDALYRF